jgi:hypothetical protein
VTTQLLIDTSIDDGFLDLLFVFTALLEVLIKPCACMPRSKQVDQSRLQIKLDVPDHCNWSRSIGLGCADSKCPLAACDRCDAMRRQCYLLASCNPDDAVKRASGQQVNNRDQIDS